MNKVILIGNIVQDITLKYLQGGVVLCDNTLAVNHYYRDSNNEKKHDTCYIDFQCFGKQAELLKEYLHKGSKICLEGRLILQKWEKEGKKYSRHLVNVEKLEFLDSQHANNPANKRATQTNQDAEKIESIPF